MSQMTSTTELCNLALQRIGEKTITSLDQGTETARRCQLAYPQARDALLRSHPWNFAVKRRTLAATPATSAWDEPHAFPLPNDFLRLLRASAQEYRIEGRSLVTDANTVSIAYIWRNETITLRRFVY